MLAGAHKKDTQHNTLAHLPATLSPCLLPPCFRGRPLAAAARRAMTTVTPFAAPVAAHVRGATWVAETAKGLREFEAHVGARRLTFVPAIEDGYTNLVAWGDRSPLTPGCGDIGSVAVVVCTVRGQQHRFLGGVFVALNRVNPGDACGYCSASARVD